MARSLPPHPTTEGLRKEAKKLLSLHKNGDPSACDTLRRLARLGRADDGEILRADLGLQEAQQALAVDYGFKSWAELASFVTAGDAERAPRDASHVLRGLRWVRRATTHMGCLEGCVNHLGMDVSPGWLFGGTGHAFFMNVSDDFCPAGPHEWRYFDVIPRLGANLGVDFDVMIALPWEVGDGFLARHEAIWRAVRDALDAGRPCYGWHYEFAVIAGYDANGYLLSGPIKAPRVHPLGHRLFHSWRDFGATAGPGSVEIAAITQGQSADDTVVVQDALAFATGSAQNGEGSGIQGYDAWMRGLSPREGETNVGDRHHVAYHAAIWSECRTFAHAFLDEARHRLGGNHAPLLARAAERYRVVGDALTEVATLFPLLDGQEDEMRANVESADRRAQAIRPLKAARAAEHSGLEALRQVLAAMQ